MVALRTGRPVTRSIAAPKLNSFSTQARKEIGRVFMKSSPTPISEGKAARDVPAKAQTDAKNTLGENAGFYVFTVDGQRVWAAYGFDRVSREFGLALYDGKGAAMGYAVAYRDGRAFQWAANAKQTRS